MAQREEWLTAREAADWLKLDLDTVLRWLKGGRMRGTLLSRRAGYRVAESEVEYVLQNGPRAPRMEEARAVAERFATAQGWDLNETQLQSLAATIARLQWEAE